jgi:hypothetical protein
MNIGDHIQFTSTACRGLVVKVTRHEGSHGRATEFVHVLCGPDTDGEHGGEITAFPRLHLEMVAEVI